MIDIVYVISFMLQNTKTMKRKDVFINCNESKFQGRTELKSYLTICETYAI